MSSETEPFPAAPVSSPRPNSATDSNVTRSRGSSSTSGRLRSASMRFLESNPPMGFTQATGEVAAQAPTLGEIRRGSFSHGGWTEEGQMERRGSSAHEIQRRRLSRINSGGIRTLLSDSQSPQTPTVHESHEEHDFFPAVSHQSHQHREPSSDRRASNLAPIQSEQIPPTTQAKSAADVETANAPSSSSVSPSADIAPEDPLSNEPVGPDETGTFPNGYRFPPKHPWPEATVIGLKAFWKFFLTPFGFLLTIYGLNVVAWGAMIFFVLLKACPAMCHPTCDDLYSARKIWIEIDSQILNGLFCVTGFGLIPWRFRDFYYLMKWRVTKTEDAFRKLAGIHRGWFRLPGSDSLSERLGPPPKYSEKEAAATADIAPPDYEEIESMKANPSIPLPPTSMPPPPLTGIRAKPTKPWLLDLVIWMYLMNTVFQACLAGFMWGMNRFNRPSWATGFFISIGCVVAMVGGYIAFREGSKIKKIEGIPVDEDVRLEDIEEGMEENRVNEKKQKPMKGHHWYKRR